MRKVFVYFLFCFFAFISCETDVEVHAPWEELTVVYGLIDQSQEYQFIKINKTFLGKEDALYMAGISNSINIDPDNFTVILYQSEEVEDMYSDTINNFINVSNKFFKLTDSLELQDTIIDKDDGLFANDKNIIYTVFTNTKPTFFNTNKSFLLSIRNNKTGNHVTAVTKLIPNLTITNEIYFENEINFYNPNNMDSLRFLSRTVSWNEPENGVIYQLELVFNYIEDNEYKSVLIKSPLVNNEESTKIKGKDFFNALQNNIQTTSNIVRTINDFDLRIIVGTQELKTYIEVNQPISGIVQERPQFSNINNGIGLFSARYIKEYKGITIHSETKKFIIDSLSQLNFK